MHLILHLFSVILRVGLKSMTGFSFLLKRLSVYDLVIVALITFHGLAVLQIFLM